MEGMQSYLKRREEMRDICFRHIENGVMLWNADDTFIEDTVQIAPGAVILPGCILTGETVIEKDCIIGPRTTLGDCTVHAGAHVQETVAEKSEIGEKAKVGPFTYIRPGSKIGKGCKVGDFVELKNATLGDGTKASHLTYIGDATVGQNVNFGCGTVTVNYDGKSKHRTEIGDGAFIGCNTNLVAPASVGNGAYIAAGSTITDPVPEHVLAIARARQVIKENWKDKREKDE